MSDKVFMNDMVSVMKGGDDGSREGLEWLMTPKMKESYNRVISRNYEVTQEVIPQTTALAIPQTRALAVYKA
jgi:hypothetical protein